MKNFFLLSIVFLIYLPNLAAQEEEKNLPPPEGWNTEGTIQLLFNQSAFNKEWTGGGTSSLAANLLFDYDLNYREGDFTWDNKILANYGLTKTSADDFTRKTSDRLELNSIAGKQLSGSNWYYTFFTNFRTQFSPGYKFAEEPGTGESIRTETSRFVSPAYLQAGPGMMWKKSDDLHVNIAPATARFIFVHPDFTTAPAYVDGDYYGVDAGESSRFELGASLSAFAKINLVENVSLENTLSLYSNYLDRPSNIDIDYLLNLEMGVNDYLSANFIFQAIYDDNAVGAFQIREVLGIGFNYGL